jgi:hypothetical protein
MTEVVQSKAINEKLNIINQQKDKTENEIKQFKDKLLQNGDKLQLRIENKKLKESESKL